MTRKQSRPCLVCSKRLPASQSRRICSHLCRQELRTHLKERIKANRGGAPAK